MDKLRNVIEEHPDWDFLGDYVERIVTYKELDFSLSFENAKALLESTGKEICRKGGTELKKNSTLNGVMKQAFSSLGFTKSDMIRQVSTSLATIGQQIGNLRNDIGSTSHGKSADEIKERNNKIDSLSKDFLIDSIEIVCLYLIRNSELKINSMPTTGTDLDMPYENESMFNSWWDEQFGEFEMGVYSYPASEILFNVDKQAYVNEYKAYTEIEE